MIRFDGVDDTMSFDLDLDGKECRNHQLRYPRIREQRQEPETKTAWYILTKTEAGARRLFRRWRMRYPGVMVQARKITIMFTSAKAARAMNFPSPQ